MRSLDVDRHLAEMVLHVWIFDLILRGDVVERVVVRGFGSAEKRGGVVRDETRLPAFFQILAGITNQIGFGNERVAKVDQVTRSCAHADRIPPRGVDLDTDRKSTRLN